jgi:hypothetical protein
MVEITLPIILQIVQTVGILVGIAYYLIIMRNSQRSQQIQLETRQALSFEPLNLFLKWMIFEDESLSACAKRPAQIVSWGQFLQELKPIIRDEEIKTSLHAFIFMKLQRSMFPKVPQLLLT